IELAPTAAVRGRVVDASTRLPIPRFAVSLRPATGPTPGEDLGGRNRFSNAADGAFVIKDAPLGEATLSFEADGYRPKEIEGVSITGDGDVLDQEVALEPGASLRGRVAGLDGTGIPDAAVSVGGSDGGAAETDENGAYEVKGLATGEARVEIQKTGYRTARRTIEVRASTRLDVTLSPGLALRGTVVSGEAAASNVRVEATSSATEADSQSAATDATGRFTLEGLGPGRYDVSAT